MFRPVMAREAKEGNSTARVATSILIRNFHNSIRQIL